MSFIRKVTDFLMGGPSVTRWNDSTTIVAGDMVVCITDCWDGIIVGRTGEFKRDGSPANTPLYNCIYCVESVVSAECGALGLTLVGLPLIWRASCFRKTKPVSIEVFQRLLAPSPKKELEPS